jgi:putative ABC transport system substrate-binding protein
MYGHAREARQKGALMAYGTNVAALFLRAAIFVDKILKGANPAELPVERPRKFNLVLNFKTAKQLGITFPPEILIRATEVIK